MRIINRERTHRYREALQRLQIVPQHFRQSHNKIETSVAFKYLTNGFAASRNFNNLLHVGNIHPVAIKRITIRIDTQHRQTRDLLGLDVGSARNRDNHRFNFFTILQQCFEIIAIDLYGNVAAHSGYQLVETHLNRLRKLVIIARNFLNGFFYLIHQSDLRLVWIRPF